MDRLVQIVRLTSRVAPDGSWAAGDAGFVTPGEARRLIGIGHARLADGESLPVMETASLSIGDRPAGEFQGRGVGRDRGSP